MKYTARAIPGHRHHCDRSALLAEPERRNRGKSAGLLRVLALLSLLLAPLSASADCGGTAGQGSCTSVTITLLYVDMYNDAWLTVGGNMAALPCTLSGGLIQVPTGATNFKAVYAMLLGAQLANRPVTIRLHPTIANCTVTYVYMQ